MAYTVKRAEMNALRYLLLTIVTENQSQKIKAEQVAKLLNSELGKEWDIVYINKYHKLQNAYKIALRGTFTETKQNELNHLAISLTDKLLSPWLVYYKNDENTFELIYNKNQSTLKRKTEFDVIKWAHLIIAK